MSNKQSAASGFAVIARDARVVEDKPRVTYEGQSTFWKWCSVCCEAMPHIRAGNFCQCVVCETKTVNGVMVDAV
jgi:hypothetical protein